MKFKKFNKQFLKSRNFVVCVLVFMLVIVCTVNYQFNKQGMLETSSDLQEYEELLQADNENMDVDKEPVKETANENLETDEIKVVDSNKSEADEKVKETTANITKEMVSKENMQKDTYFIDIKMNREKERGELIEELDAIVKNPSSSKNSIEEASNMKLNLVKFRESELNIESLLTAKGFENPVAYVSENNASVVVDREKLNKDDVAKIFDVVYTQTKLPFENIKIMEYKR
ncbi:SpoIIIAH-like family protein [Tepidibacter hydrothermalis]|uniref:SpoIIIAH-like family protein n=1 Tax=Tepidibacter hydrothermalis TaxID=3036126 RepID=A0ABY8E838_9FIRM|nr:SpoIIIAH-like family protein [Tepidibacter hydrothermalis]WFD09056.1 SpoIIIAH-like family protein [Tepidibacter hydrothermalis]